MRHQHWRLAPAFDLVAPISSYVPAPRRGKTQPLRLVTRLSIDDLVSAATEHYGYDEAKAKEYLCYAGNPLANNWEAMMADEGMPADEIVRFKGTFAFASSMNG